MKGWRAWYAISRTEWEVYSSADTPWQEVPSGETDGPEGTVGVVVYQDPPYRTILTGGDWYYMQDGEIRRVKNHPEWGQWAEAPDVPCKSCVKQSGALADDTFEALLVEMMEARGWP